MSVTGVSGSSFYSGINSSNVQNKFQQIQQEFKQLGQDLKSGNLTQAQSDFAALQKNLPGQQPSTATSASSGSTSGTSQTSGAQTGGALSQAVAQLGQDLQSGNLSAAQSDFATLQQDIQQQQGSSQAPHHHHHHHGGGSQDAGSSPQNGISALFNQLGQELQTGSLSQAQQTYSTLQQDFQQFAASNGLGSSTSGTSTVSSTSSSSGGLNVTA